MRITQDQRDIIARHNDDIGAVADELGISYALARRMVTAASKPSKRRTRGSQARETARLLPELGKKSARL